MLKIPLLEHEGGIFCFNYSDIFRMEFRVRRKMVNVLRTKMS